ncbi:hypothetical protein ACFWJM_27335, partial [Streptomyces sp. NPDC127077]
MGVYLVSVCAEDWFTEGEDGWGDVASALNHELRQRGLPPYESVPEEPDFVRGSGQAFEEKLIPSMNGFWALCQAQLSPEEEEIACGWNLLVPFSLNETITLPGGGGGAGAPPRGGRPPPSGWVGEQRLAPDTLPH